jgi:hypothetical protein
VVKDEAEARAAVRELKAAGVDFLKTHRATASFLLVEADPTRDIRNLRRLSGVVLRGNWLDRNALAQLRAAG